MSDASDQPVLPGGSPRLSPSRSVCRPGGPLARRHEQIPQRQHPALARMVPGRSRSAGEQAYARAGAEAPSAEGRTDRVAAGAAEAGVAGWMGRRGRDLRRQKRSMLRICEAPAPPPFTRPG